MEKKTAEAQRRDREWAYNDLYDAAQKARKRGLDIRDAKDTVTKAYEDPYLFSDDDNDDNRD